MASRTGYVYFLQTVPAGYIKIGATRRQPDARIPELASGCPFEIELLACFFSRDCFADEKKAHEFFHAAGTSTEWFAISAEQAFDYLNSIGVSCGRSHKWEGEFEFLESTPCAVLCCSIVEEKENGLFKCPLSTFVLETEPCPFCGKRHRHGLAEGHRVAHCGRRIKITLPSGVMLDNNHGYILRLTKQK